MSVCVHLPSTYAKRRNWNRERAEPVAEGGGTEHAPELNQIKKF